MVWPTELYLEGPSYYFLLLGVLVVVLRDQTLKLEIKVTASSMQSLCSVPGATPVGPYCLGQLKHIFLKAGAH